MINWIHAGPTILAAFLASLVEFVEAFTIVLAAGAVRGWRGALTGVAAGLGTLALIVVAGGSLLERFPLAELRLAIGVLLLLFGMRWLRKSTLRAAGVISLHDESAAYTSETAVLHRGVARRSGIDTLAVLTAFNGVLVEGIEVVFIVIATGAAGHLLIPAAIGAGVAGAVVLTAGILLRVPLTRVPENSLKLAVGVLLSAFGTFWIGEGAGYVWPGNDLSLIWLTSLYFCTAIAIAMLAKRYLNTPTKT
jgi:Ca2+/H+ antiporter, TMEM165/GDT1 family